MRKTSPPIRLSLAIAVSMACGGAAHAGTIQIMGEGNVQDTLIVNQLYRDGAVQDKSDGNWGGSGLGSSGMGYMNETNNTASGSSENYYGFVLVKFDLTALTSGLAPGQSIVVNSAAYSGYIGNNNNQTAKIHRMTHDWVEGTINTFWGSSATPDGATWNTYDGTNSWTGGSFSTADYDTTAVATQPLSLGWGTGIWRSSDIAGTDGITGVVQGWLDGTYDNDGIVIIDDARNGKSGLETSYLRFTEHSGGGGNFYYNNPGSTTRQEKIAFTSDEIHPSLIIDYTVIPEPASLALLGLAGVTMLARRSPPSARQ